MPTNITADTIIPFLERCGYTNQQLLRKYTYYFQDQERQLDLVGFSQAAYNSSTACIAVMDGNNYEEADIKNQVLKNQSLGSPVVLVFQKDILKFWHFSQGLPVQKEETNSNNLDGFFAKYIQEFSPDRIYRAKNFGRANINYQLSFVDRGLMPLIEKQEGEYLSNLVVRINDSLYEHCNRPKNDEATTRWLFQAGFWLIGAKILKDKDVPGFKTLKLSDVDSLVGKIKRHYNAGKQLDITNKIQKTALEKVAREIVEPISSLSHITTESMAYVYENALVSKETRKAMGTHATPSWLVNYIVWQLADWIEEIPEKDRLILEPACGHAPFLTAGARALSFFYKGSDDQRHAYLRDHLVGIERDPFAEEIARLALTLSDIPNNNGWQIKNHDIYGTDILKQIAPKIKILLCNPPFENFSKEEKDEYKELKTDNKAAEVLFRTLPYMQQGSIFGVILPQGFLHKKNLTALRKLLLDDFELRIICNLPDKVFAEAEHLCSVLLGRKGQSRKKIAYVRVNNKNLEYFKDTYNTEEELISKKELYAAKDNNFRIPQLKGLWEYCAGCSKLGEYIEVGRGIEYKNAEKSISKTKINNQYHKGFARFKKHINGKEVDIKISELPDTDWMSLNKEDIENPRYGADIGKPQIVINYLRSSRYAWRIKGLLDIKGHPVSNSLLVARPKHKDISLYIIWALINSPYANMYMFDHCMERLNLEGELRQMPVPFGTQDLRNLDNLVQKYFSLYDQNHYELENSNLEREKLCALLAIDAEIMRLYDLPPKLEKQLLDSFLGYRRKGVEFKFDGYYPAEFDSCIPLHEYISEEYQRSTAAFAEEWVKEQHSERITKILKNATEAFDEEEEA